MSNEHNNFLSKVNLWTGFYRANPHRFVKDYFKVKLRLFQIFLIYMMDNSSFFMYLAARGQGKSFIIGVYSLIRCVLYPGTKIVIASGTKDQATLIVKQHILKIINDSPFLGREVGKIKLGKDGCLVPFLNGSSIESVVSSDNSRGNRAHILILEEFRMIDKGILDTVLRRFNATPRQAKFMQKPQYAKYKESNKELYISSAYYKNHWSYQKFLAFVDAMIKGRNYSVVGLPVELSIEENLLGEEDIENIKKETDHNEITWLMEMDCMWWGENENSYFKLDHFTDNRSDKVQPFYPRTNIEYIEMKNSKKKIENYFSKYKRISGEIRIISVDVALMGGNKNDNTIFTCFRLIPSENRYERQIPFIQSINGLHSETQAILLKRLYEDFQADYIIMDTMGNGMTLYDAGAKTLYDSERDVEYLAWSAYNNKSMEARTLSSVSLPIVYSLKANAQINHEIAVKLKSSLESKIIRFLDNENSAKEYLTEKWNYESESIEQRAKLLNPYIQTTALVNETVSLEYTIADGGKIKVSEVGSNRKDRYSSLAYGNYYADLLEKSYLKPMSGMKKMSM